MNIKISLIYKLVSLILFSIILSLSFATFFADYYIKNIFMDNHKQQIIYGFENIGEEFRENERELLKNAKIISSNEIVQVTTRLVSLYEDKEKYNKELFDTSKKDLVDLFFKYIKISNLSNIEITDKDDNLIAFVKLKNIKGIKEYLLGFVSYKNGKRIINIKEGNKDFLQYDTDIIKTSDKHKYLESNKVGYMVENDFLKLQLYTQIKLNNNKLIGYIHIDKTLTNEDIQKQFSSKSIKLSFNSVDKLKADIKSVAVLLFSKLSYQKLNLLENESNFESYAIISAVKKESAPLALC